ncbi:MAG TPA: LacI family DNA-binding transcriptional regulator [Luteimicrobium sp.]|jgi:LacI family transcriptional regulator|nr:LacI family DNA-binding transcriptional regulator [Luteimicrobium sp.]
MGADGNETDHKPDHEGTAAGPDRGSGRRPTLADVAERAGVSLKTASRVMNGERYVAEQTRERVLAVADDLGFRLNPMASLLKRGVVPGVVAFVTGDLANPFYSVMAKGVEQEVRALGLQLTIASSDEDPDAEVVLVDEFALRRVRGIILTSTLTSHASFVDVQERGVPIVFVDRPPSGMDADAFLLDNYGGTRAAVEHLLAAGHRRIAYVGDYARLHPQRERQRAFGDAMEAAGVTDWRSLVREGAHDAESAAAAVQSLLAEDPGVSAVFSSNNRITTGVLHAMAELAPDLALVGFDDFDLADLLGVTTVSYDPAEIGRQAARALLAREGRRVDDPQTWVLPTRLVARGSGERPPRPRAS